MTPSMCDFSSFNHQLKHTFIHERNPSLNSCAGRVKCPAQETGQVQCFWFHVLAVDDVLFTLAADSPSWCKDSALSRKLVWPPSVQTVAVGVWEWRRAVSTNGQTPVINISMPTRSHLIWGLGRAWLHWEQSQLPHYWLLVNYIKVASASHSNENSWLALRRLMENMLGFSFGWLYISSGCC